MFSRLPLLLILGLSLAGCGSHLPACKTAAVTVAPPSAGCLALRGDSLLVVRMRDTGRISVPGGSAYPGETAACTAQRETQEETGLLLKPGPLVAEFDTGFHLLHCTSSDPHPEPASGFNWEVERAYWLPLAEFEQVRWRFPGQGAELRPLVESLLEKAGMASRTTR